MGAPVNIIKFKKSPNHAIFLIARTIIWAILAYFTSERGEFISIFLGYQLAFWFPFDMGLNLSRGLAWNYVGKTAWLDKLIPYDIAPLKILLMIIGIGLLIMPLGY